MCEQPPQRSRSCLVVKKRFVACAATSRRRSRRSFGAVMAGGGLRLTIGSHPQYTVREGSGGPIIGGYFEPLNSGPSSAPTSAAAQGRHRRGDVRAQLRDLVGAPDDVVGALFGVQPPQDRPDGGDLGSGAVPGVAFALLHTRHPRAAGFPLA